MVKRFGIGTMAALGVTVLIWSTTFAAMVAALSHFSPQHLMFLRWTFTALLFAVVAVVTKMRVPRVADLPKIALAGVLGFSAYQMLLVNGQMGITATMAGFLINMSPVFTTVIAVGMRKERSVWTTWSGLVLCTVGLLVMAQGKGGIGEVGASAGLVVLAALSFAMYTLVTKPLLTTYRPLEVTTYAIIAGSLPFLVFAPGSMAALASASTVDVANLLYLAIFPGAIAYVLWSRAVKGLTPGIAARFLYLVPVLGVPVAWVWVGEAPSPATVAGGLVIIGGVALAAMRPAPRAVVVREPSTDLRGSAVAPEAA